MPPWITRLKPRGRRVGWVGIGVLGFVAFLWAAEPSASLQLIVLPLHYQDLRAFGADVEALTDALRHASPFHELSDGRISWELLAPLADEATALVPVNGTPPLAIRLDVIKRLDAAHPAPYKLVVLDATGRRSCAELSELSRRSVIILGSHGFRTSTLLGRGFLHELGHALGLRDECVRCAATGDAGFPNCARTRAEAEAWWGSLVGVEPRVDFFSGCAGRKDYVRPTMASLMNDPAHAGDFGAVNERYLRQAFGAAPAK